MHIESRIYLRERFPALYPYLKDTEEEAQAGTQFVREKAKSGQETLLQQTEGKTFYLHSRYDPIREAKALIEKYEESLSQEVHVLFYGTGLGYHIEEFVSQYPKATFSIYEPNTEVFHRFLDRINLKKTAGKNLLGMGVGNQYTELIQKLSAKTEEKIVLVELPAVSKYEGEEGKAFIQAFTEQVKNKRSSLATNYSFQKRWILNSVVNFKTVLDTPNFLIENKDVMKGKTGILIAAGPSLDEELERLKYIKEHKLAYLFSVGSAINTLIANDIYPDAMFTYDPTQHNQKVFDKMNREGIDDIPMIFGSSVGFETLKNYPGGKMHFLTSQDTIGKYFIKEKDTGTCPPIINDAPSIAVITLQMMMFLHFQKVVLVGQNLAYLGDQFYSKDIDYYQEKNKGLSEEEKKNLIQVQDVHGNPTYTNPGFDRMRKQMELYTERVSNTEVINSTKGGAAIEGTIYRPLSEVLEDMKPMDTTVITEQEKTIYDLDFLQEQKETLFESYKRFTKGLNDLKDNTEKLGEQIKQKNMSQLEETYRQIDESLKAITDSDFYRMIIMPFNRVDIDLFNKKLQKAKANTNKLQRASDMYGGMASFLQIIYQSNQNELLKKVMIQLYRDVENFVEKKKET
ncbi:MAG TPA: hypothetical protein DHN33_03510 [Eubacteriaceae bacterium]|nr:hypothetical protein [Eubacteriaceae bacterium]